MLNCQALKTNYILVDFENVQPDSIPSSPEFEVKVLIFNGEHRKNISFELASSLQVFGDQVEYVKMEGNGPNALDFHIAYFIGKLVERDPDSYFHIVSKDKGFDPLISYLKKHRVFSQRVEDVADVFKRKGIQHSTPKRKVKPCELIGKAEVVAVSLKNQSARCRPAKVKPLMNVINSFFQKSLSNNEIQKIISILQKKKILKVIEKKVSYQI